jgi:hypothetical protein
MSWYVSDAFSIGHEKKHQALPQCGRPLHRLLAAIAFLVLVIARHTTAAEPIAPCDGAPFPAFARPGPMPALALWRVGDLPADWVPPACSGWPAREGGVVFAVAGRFEHKGSFDLLLARAGAFSRQTEMRYWNIKKARWERQYEASAALDSSSPASRRPDFVPADFNTGARLYFVQDAADSLGPIVQELIVRERSATRLVATTRNVSEGRIFGWPVVGLGGLEGFWAVEHEGGALWRYYALTRVHLLISDAMAPSPEDYLNKAVSLFRFLSGMPTDIEPPASR